MAASFRRLECSELPAAGDVIRVAFGTVSEAFGLTEENCPTNGAFLRDAALFEEAAARRAGGRRLSIGVMYENRALVRWYERAAFAPVGTRTFPHLPFVVCFMERDLTESA